MNPISRAEYDRLHPEAGLADGGESFSDKVWFAGENQTEATRQPEDLSRSETPVQPQPSARVSSSLESPAAKPGEHVNHVSGSFELGSTGVLQVDLGHGVQMQFHSVAGTRVKFSLQYHSTLTSTLLA